MNQRPVYRFDDFVVDPGAWRLSRGGQEVHLDPVVLKLLIYLVTNRDRLVTRQELMDTVWGDTVISESALTKAVARLRQALGDDAATHRYLETVRSQGYRFVAAVEKAECASSPPRAIPARSVARGLLAGAAGIVTLIFLAVFWFRGPPQAEAVRSLAVLPLKNLTGDPEQDYYADGLHDLLITELYRLPGLGVTSRQSTMRYRSSRLSMTDIAGELGVDALIEGSLLRKGSTIEVTVQLIDGRSDKHLWAEQYTGETPSVMSLVADMADAIGAEIGAAAVSPEAEERIHNGIAPVDPRAIDAYALGTTRLALLSRDGIRTAIGQFETAVELEPAFAQAWSQLAAAHAMEGLFGFASPRDSIAIARRAALKAIEADEQFFGGFSALGWVRLWTGDIDGACELFEEALRLNPSGPAAIHGKADCLMFDGRMDESVDRLRELVTISPFTLIHNIPLTAHLFMARRFDEAIIAATAMQARLPQFSMHWFFAKVYWQQGLFDKALEEERLELEQHGDTELLAALEEGLDIAGPTGAMRAMAEVLAARASESYVEPFDVGETFARAGSVDEALYWLGRAVENGSYEIAYIGFWPHLDVLRNDDRYHDLVDRVYGQRAQDIRQRVNPGPRHD
jgi:TolB-like protein/DNA-binding winged helix-turn-helix (wHTH) protein